MKLPVSRLLDARQTSKSDAGRFNESRSAVSRVVFRHRREIASTAVLVLLGVVAVSYQDELVATDHAGVIADEFSEFDNLLQPDDSEAPANSETGLLAAGDASPPFAAEAQTTPPNTAWPTGPGDNVRQSSVPPMQFGTVQGQQPSPAQAPGFGGSVQHPEPVNPPAIAVYGDSPESVSGWPTGTAATNANTSSSGAALTGGIEFPGSKMSARSVSYQPGSYDQKTPATQYR